MEAEWWPPSSVSRPARAGVRAARAQQGGVRARSIGSAFACTQAHERTRSSGSQ